MLIEHTIATLRSLRLGGMADAFEHQRSNASLQELSFEDRFSMLVDAEKAARESKRLSRLTMNAKFKAAACPEDIDYRTDRGLDKQRMASLLSCDWIVQNQHLLVSGPTGVGKTWLVCAVGNQAIRLGMPVLYKRFVRLLEEFEIAREDGSLPKLRAQLAKARLLILDDWGIAPLTPRNRQDLFEIIEDRTGSGSLAITAQLPVIKWHDYIGDPTLADAILDRLVHSAHRIELKGESMRRVRKSKETK